MNKTVKTILIVILKIAIAILAGYATAKFIDFKEHGKIIYDKVQPIENKKQGEIKVEISIE